MECLFTGGVMKGNFSSGQCLIIAINVVVVVVPKQKLCFPGHQISWVGD